jgi:putative transposase
MPMKIPLPTPNHAEQVALFRNGVVGDLITSDLEVGELQAELKRRAKRLYRPPGSKTTRTYHWKTLQRWLYAARDSLAALKPECRQRGYGLALTPEARVVLLDMRQEHPNAAADLILDEAVRYGVVEKGAISLPTLRRLFARADLARAPRNRQERRRDRRRWEADRVCRIWHADVCHVWQREPDGRPIKRYVHGLLDDCSRFGLDLEAREGETECDLLVRVVEALLRFPAPEILYVDNGATYRGDLLTLALSKLGIRVVHAEPHDPEARGKMERFWRTLRQRMLDFQPPRATLHDLNASLLAWLDADYHRRAHGGLMGQTPARRFQEGVRNLAAPLTIEQIAAAFEVPREATIRKDATFSVNGRLFEVRGRHLAGKRIALALDPFTGLPIRANHDDKVIAFAACDPKANGRRSRGDVQAPAVPPSTRFDRIAGLLAAARKVTDE